MRTLTLSILLLTALPLTTNAYWFNDPARGMTVVCNASGNQIYPSACSLAGNRLLIAWTDQQLGVLNQRCYYQVLDYRGEPLLAINGIRVFDGEWVNATWPFISVTLPDGQGGCIILVSDKRSGHYEFYGQRIDSLGNRLWGNNGRPLATFTQNSDMFVTDFTMDSTGNYFIVFSTNPFIGLYAQKFDRDGNLPWSPYGVSTCTSGSAEYPQKAIINGAGGLIDAWKDHRISEPDVYGQNLNSAGENLWTINGIFLQNNVNDIAGGIPDGAGGGMFVYDSYWNWFVFRVNGSGQVLWSIPFLEPDTCSTTYPTRQPTDGSLWTITVWNPGSGWGRFLYRVTLGGASTFGQNGIYTGNAGGARLVLSGNGVITNISNIIGGIQEIQSMRIDNTGQIVWTSLLNRLGPGGAYGYMAACSDDSDGALCAWSAGVNENDIYAQHLKADGTLGAFEPSPVQPSQPVSPLRTGDRGYSFYLSRPAHISLTLFDLLGRKIRTIAEGYYPVGLSNVAFNPNGLASGIYWLHLATPYEQQTQKVVVVR
jgi:hypothetical protein